VFPQLFELMEVQKSFLAAADVHATVVLVVVKSFR
jgi:hypothetical protein